jgi:hypothetical protein
MNSYLLAGYLALTPYQAYAGDERDAGKYLAKALYIEYGISGYLSRFEKRYLKFDKYPELSYIGVVARVGIERRITYTWRF